MNFFSRWRRTRLLRRHAIPEALWQEALAVLPFLAAWPPSELEALRATATLFLRDKSIVGARGFVVTPFQRVVVAVQACIPVLKLGLQWYSDFKTVVLYSDEFISRSEWEGEDGVVHFDDAPTAGEAMPGGPVVLSWPDALDFSGEREGEEGEEEVAFLAPPAGNIPQVSVVIHEFAHKLDMRNGEANGCPPLPRELSAKRWQRAMQQAYEDFCFRTARGEDMGMDTYAAEDASEFFAVLSEIFFIAPKRLRETYPEVYECFRLFYRFEVNESPRT